MGPYDTYRIYQIERAKSPAEVRREDQQAAQLASALSSLFHGITWTARAEAFVVNVLSAGQEDVSRWFANRDRTAGSAMFDGVPFELGITGCPVLVDATVSFECQLRQSHRAGDHLIVLGEVVALIHRPQLEPLIFHTGRYKSLEHRPLSEGSHNCTSSGCCLVGQNGLV